MEFVVYILESQKFDRMYIGQTNNLKDRIRRHNVGLVPATRACLPWSLLHEEKYKTRSEAVQREKYLKSLKSKKYILENIIFKKEGRPD